MRKSTWRANGRKTEFGVRRRHPLDLLLSEGLSVRVLALKDSPRSAGRSK
jgi:hypothetical protein